MLERLMASAKAIARKAPIRMVLSLIGARAVYRVGLLSASIILYYVWGEDEFNGYALAMGSFGVLSFITTLGVEKSALKMIPRVRYTRRQLTTVFVVFPLVISTGCAGWVLWIGVTSEFPILMMLAGGMAICSGLNQVLVGLHRVHDRPTWDVVNYLLLATAVGVAILGAVLGGLGPVGVLSILFGSVLLANIVLIPFLPLGSVRRVRKPLVWSSIRASVLMSAEDISGSAIVSFSFVLIGQSDFHDQAGHMYIVLEGSSFVMAAFGYILRILQPRISVYMHRDDSAELVFQRAKRALKVLFLGGMPYLAVIAVGGFAWEAINGERAGAVLIFLLYLAGVPCFMMIGTINYLLENHDNRSFKATAAGSTVGMIAACGVALILVPYTGALGALLCWALADIIHSATILTIFRITGTGRDDPATRIEQPARAAVSHRPDSM